MTVQGFPWCQDSREIGAGSLTAKHLCTSHNGRLSSTDSAALTLFKEFRDRFDLGAAPSMNPTDIDGNSLERWFLKTGISMWLIGEKKPRWPSFYREGVVPFALAKTAFGEHRMTKPCGLYFYNQAGYEMDSFDGVFFDSLTEADDRILGFSYRFRGHPILLWLDHTPVDNCILPDGLSGRGFQYRPDLINLTRGGAPFRSIKLTWN